MGIYRIGQQLIFPPVHHAQDGLLAFGGDLRPERLLAAYSQGIFPWYSDGDPVLWWAPEERMILKPEGMHIARRLRRTLRTGRFSAAADTCFSSVIEHCAHIARKREDGTWILPDMIEAYTRLHHLGYAHSIEIFREGRLVGGLYGVSLGAVFFGESMFSLERDASKIAFAVLARQCARWSFSMIDCQMWTSHLESLGAVAVSRYAFMLKLRAGLRKKTRKGIWRLDEDILSFTVPPGEEAPE